MCDSNRATHTKVLVEDVLVEVMVLVLVKLEGLEELAVVLV